MAAARYVALNPVRRGLSSVRAHLDGRNVELVEAASLLSRAAGRFADLFERSVPTPKSWLGLGRPKASGDGSTRRPSSIGWLGVVTSSAAW